MAETQAAPNRMPAKRCLLVIMLAQIGTSCDNATLSLAASELIGALSATVGDIQLASMIYALAAGAFMIAGGMVGVMIGWRKNLRLGLVLAVCGELALALSPNMFVFSWVGRLLVGLGASFITPSVLGLVPALWQGRDRVFAFGCIAAAIALATAVSLPFGLLLDAFGFRATFATFAGYFALIFLLAAVLPNRVGAPRKGSFDFAGFALASCGLLLFLLGVSRMSAWGAVEASSLAPFTLGGFSPALPLAFAGIAVLAVLIVVERRVEERRGFALLPRAFTHNVAALQGLLAVLLPYFFMGSLLIVMTPFVQLVAGFSALQTSLATLLVGAPMLVFAMFFPRVFPKVSPRATIAGGYAGAAVGAVLIAVGFEAAGVGPAFFVGMVVAGASLGTVNSQANNAVASAVDPRNAEQSGGIQGAARNVGMALGSAVLGTVLLLSVNASLPAAVASLPTVPADVRQAVGEAELSFMGDDELAAALDGLPVHLDEGARQALVDANVQARVDAARLAMGALAVLTLLCLAGTRRLSGTPVAAVGPPPAGAVEGEAPAATA